MKKIKVPTHTSVVLAVLREQDDFLNYTMLLKLTGLTINQVSAACLGLRKYRAVDCIIDPNGVAWWYACPEQEDARTCVHCERTPEKRPRKPRKPKQRKIDPNQWK